MTLSIHLCTGVFGVEVGILFVTQLDAYVLWEVHIKSVFRSN